MVSDLQVLFPDLETCADNFKSFVDCGTISINNRYESISVSNWAIIISSQLEGCTGDSSWYPLNLVIFRFDNHVVPVLPPWFEPVRANLGVM